MGRLAALSLVLIATSAFSAAICPAEKDPEWAKADATRKRELFRECRPLPTEPAEASPAVPEPPPQPGRGSVPVPSQRARRSAQLLGASIATSVAVGGLAATFIPIVGTVGLAISAIAALAIAPVVLLAGWGERQWGLPLLGTVLGTALGLVGMVGAAVGGVLLGWSGDTINFGSIVGGITGLVLTLPLPVLGAVFGYELGLKANRPAEVALVPLQGGVMAAITARF